MNILIKSYYRPYLLDRCLRSIYEKVNDAKELKPSAGLVLRGFEIEDDKGNHLPVKASILKNKVHLVVPSGLTVSKVLYAWQPFTRANLVNEAGLPASTFSITIK